MSARYLQRLVEDARVVELRVERPTGWHCGLFDDVSALAACIQQADQAGSTMYTTLNRPSTDLLVTNRISQRHGLCNSDIGTIVRIPFDLDPERPTGTAATDAELARAIEARTQLVRLLTGQGWPMPAIGVSGNGAHALYRVHIKAGPGWRDAAEVIYNTLRDLLADTCTEQGTRFDMTVRNPARVWRVYGYLNRKGEPTPERPHRMAEITLPAGPWQTVKVEQVNRTVTAWRPAIDQQRETERCDRKEAIGRIEGRGDYGTLNVVDWFRAHGHLLAATPRGNFAVRCPWTQEHNCAPGGKDTSTVVWPATGGKWPTFHCSHDHCRHRRLLDVMQVWGDADAFCSRVWEGRRHA